MDLTAVLQRPVPNFSPARKRRTRYREYPLAARGPRNAEPLVDIAEYGLAGQSFYSRPNNTTGEPVAGISPTVLLRKSIAEKLSAINFELQRSDKIAKLLGGRVELYIDEGLRSSAMQRELYERHIPALIRAQHPQWSDAQVLARRDELISRPSDGSLSPAPHATGAAVDLKVRFVCDNPGFVPQLFVPMGSRQGITIEETYPDYFEHKRSLTTDQETARRNRRVFFWTMRGALNGDDFGLAVNPTEWWHWSFGDQLWAANTQAPLAFFGLPPK